MIFRIVRSGETDDSTDKPIEGAVWGQYIYNDIRTVDSPDKMRFVHGDKNEYWYGFGFDHRVVNGWITRSCMREGWLLEISSLGELVELHKRMGEKLIISTNGDTLQLEIYDDYRE